MSKASDAPGWDHHSGYRLGPDRSIEYRRDDGARVWIEGLRPDPAFLPEDPTDEEYEAAITYYGVFRHPVGDDEYRDEGPKYFETEDAAEAWQQQIIDENPLPGGDA